MSNAIAWSNLEGLNDRLVVLTDEGIVLANPPKEETLQLAEAVRLDATGAPEAVHQHAKKAIRLESITKVAMNRHGDNVQVNYKASAKEPATIDFISFDRPEDRDEFLEEVAARLGNNWERNEIEYGVVQAAVAPVITGAVVAFVVWITYMLAAELAKGETADPHGRHVFLKRMFAWVASAIGPTGVLIIGALILLGVLAWLVARVKKPPIMVTLKPA